MLLERIGSERRAEAHGRLSAGLLQHPLRTVPAQNVGPLLFGGIIYQGCARGLHLRRRGKNLCCERLEGHSQMRSTEDSAGTHLLRSKMSPGCDRGAGWAHYVSRGARNAVESVDAQDDGVSIFSRFALT